MIARRNLCCKESETIESFCRQLAPLQVVVEASTSSEWFVKLIEPLADRALLSHPKKLGVYRPEHEEDRQTRRRGAGGILGTRHNSSGPPPSSESS